MHGRKELASEFGDKRKLIYGKERVKDGRRKQKQHKCCDIVF
jgi:hypothetical protein